MDSFAYAVAQDWKVLWNANAYGTLEYSSGIRLIGSPARNRNAYAAECKYSITSSDTDDTQFYVYSCPDGDTDDRSSDALDTFVVATSGGDKKNTFMVFAELAGSGFCLGIMSIGSTTDMVITLSYRLLR